MSEGPVQPLLAQHCDKRGQQRHQKACVQEIRGRDNLCRGAIPRWRTRRDFVWSNGSVEVEENGPKVGIGEVWLELGLDVDDEGGADGGEQTGLKMWLT